MKNTSFFKPLSLLSIIALLMLNIDAFSQSGPKWATEGNNADTSDFIGTNNNSDLIFKTNGQEGMRLDNSSNLGIGTDAPTSKLDIDGQIRIRGGSPGEGKVLVSDSLGTASWESPGTFLGTQTPQVTVPSSPPNPVGGGPTPFGSGPGNVINTACNDVAILWNHAIGALTDCGMTYMGALNANWSHFITDRDRYFFDTSIVVHGGKISSYLGQSLTLRADYSHSNSVNQLVLATDGNVGIGNSSPSYKFDVSGSSRLNGNVGIGTTPSSNYKLKLGGAIHMNNYQLDYVTRIHFNDNVRFYDDGNDSYLNFKYGDVAGGGIKIRDGDNEVQGYLYADGNQDFGLRDGDASWSYRASKDDYTEFLINGSTKMRINSNGNVGIGTNDPTQRLHVEGGVLRLDYNSNYDVWIQGGENLSNNDLRNLALLGRRTDDKLFLNYASQYTGGTIIGGPVGIGGTATEVPTGYLLAVDGKIICEAIKVKPYAAWGADYVFEEGYSLMPLNKLEKSIKRNKHLPGVPSAAEAQAEGVDIVEMNFKLLEKIEELTLYVIALKKENIEIQEELKVVHQLVK